MKERICYVVGAGEDYGLDFQPVTGDIALITILAKKRLRNEVRRRLHF